MSALRRSCQTSAACTHVEVSAYERSVTSLHPSKWRMFTYSLCGVLFVLCVLSDCQYENIILIVVMIANDIIISLD